MGIGVSVVSTTLLLMGLLLVVAWAVSRFGAKLAGADLERFYLYLGATFAFALAATGTLVALRQTLNLWVGSARDLRYAADILGEATGYALVAWPTWFLHFRRAADLSRLRQATSLHRLYLYLVAIGMLVAAITFGGLLVAQGVRLIIGTVNLSDPWALPELYSNAATGLVEGSLCAAVWWLSMRAVNHWQDKVPATAPAGTGG